ncbi:MAG: sigma-54-dependent Fis family transcriptional regulator [Candidatus Thiodiazotropha sp.]
MFGAGQSHTKTIEELIKITTSLSTERDLNRLLNMIVTSARILTCSEAGRVYVLDNTKRYLYPEVCQNEKVATEKIALPNIPVSVAERINTVNVCIYSAFSGKLLRIDDVYRYSGFDFSDIYEYDRRENYRTHSLLTVPLRNHEGITIGVLQLLNPRDGENGTSTVYPVEIENLVNAFASQAAVALNNVQLIENNRYLIEVLDNTNRILEMENERLMTKIQEQSRFTNIIGESPSMQKVFSLMKKVVDSQATVLLLGETGTGKELFAHAVHQNSPRKKSEFIAQNCAALPENLLESELFGYVKGAFSGANSNKKGLIELAHGGTLFLDEIGDMPIGLQAKLLRVLQEGEVRPLGSTKCYKVDVRVIAATHCDLQELIRSGDFRQDLYYRLCVFPIELPPLRDRKDDLPALIQHFMGEFSDQYGKEANGFSPAAVESLLQYDYPGNIRELRNLVERAVLMCESGASILPEHLPPEIALVKKPPDSVDVSAPDLLEGRLKDAVAKFEATFIERRLESLGWNQTRTAQALAISRRALIDKMQKHQLHRPNGGESTSEGY